MEKDKLKLILVIIFQVEQLLNYFSKIFMMILIKKDIGFFLRNQLLIKKIFF